MGTKNAPGPVDCYANAEPDEPMFVLLARDPDAPQLLRAWATLREDRGEDPDRVAEVRDIATEMERYRALTPRGRCHPCGECKDNPDEHHFVDGKFSNLDEFACKHCSVTTPCCISCGEAVPFGRASQQCPECEGQ